MRDDAPLRLPAATTEIRFPAAGATLFAAEWGEGRPLVMLHGGLADHRAALWRTAPLIDRLRLVTPDLRGCGRSVAYGSQTWQQLADDVAALLDHLGLDRAVIGGVSAGCAVTARFALSHPDRCAGLVLVTPAHGGAALGLAPAQAQALVYMHAQAQRAIEEGVLVLMSMYEALPPPVRTLARQMASDFDPHAIAHHTALLASGAQPFDDGVDLEAIDRPALLVPGGDAFHPSAVSAVYAAHLPRCARHPSDIDGFPEAVMGLMKRAFPG